MTQSTEIDAPAYYCQTCEHPWGYHRAERGCTMPVDASGLPSMRTDTTIGACRCEAVKTNG